MKTYSGLKTVQAECCTLGDFIATAKRNPYEGSEQQPDSNTAGYKVMPIQKLLPNKYVKKA